MLKKETWSRQCDCIDKFVLGLGGFLIYTIMMLLWPMGGSESELLVELLPVISSEFGLNAFFVALGILYCLLMYGGAYVTEFWCDASGHCDSSREL